LAADSPALVTVLCWMCLYCLTIFIQHYKSSLLPAGWV